MKINLDESICNKHTLTIQETLIALAIKLGCDVTKVIESLIKRNVLLYNGNKLTVTTKWNSTLATIADLTTNTRSREDIANLREKMQKLYPKGKSYNSQTRAFNSPYYYRCNKTEVERKLITFFDKYDNNYTDEQVLDATKKFLESFNGDYKYLPLLKYFIIKNKNEIEEDGTIHPIEYSPLADFLENADEDNTQEDIDWTTNLI